jgi:NAD+ synthase
MGNKYKFDAVDKRDFLIDWIKAYFVKSGNENTPAVVGISGGKDSTIAAALLVRALGPERVIGVRMPEGEQHDIEEARRVCKILGIQEKEINIEYAVYSLYDAVGTVECSNNPVVFQNTPARIRMTVLYAVAGLCGGRVANTCNYSENYIGYSTKYGDEAGDFSLFGNLTVEEVLAIGDTLEELPADLVHKAPEDGLSGKTDEDNIGFTYQALDDYLRRGITPDIDTYHKITKMHEASRHKDCLTIPTFNCGLWHAF